MANRLNLHEEFCTILASRNAYCNPPASVNMRYPGIKYSLTGANIKRANNGVYRLVDRYEVIVIDYDPESDIYKKILAHFPMCSLDRCYIADNLYHFVLTLYD